MHFTRFSIFTQDLEEMDLQIGPRNSQIGPKDANLDRNWFPGAMVSGRSSIPVRGRLDSAGKGRGSAQGLTYDGFRGLDSSEGVPGRGLSRTRLRRPLRPVFRRIGGLAWDTRDLGSSRGAVGRPQKVVWVTVWFGRGSSPCGLQRRPVAVSAQRLCHISCGEDVPPLK
jgi:hypothetical protein